MEEILQEKQVRPPRRCPDRDPDGGADEPRSIQIADDQHQYVYRPDAKRAATVEVAEVVRLVAGLQKDRSDEESGKDEEEVDASPSPQRRGIEPCTGETRVAVVQDHGEDGDAAQSLKLGDVGRQPGWALDGQG